MESSWLSVVGLSLLSCSISAVVGFSVVTDVAVVSKVIKSQLCSMQLSLIFSYFTFCLCWSGVWNVALENIPNG